MEYKILLFVAIPLCCFASLLAARGGDISEGKPLTYVLVHGSTGGAWDWKTVGSILMADDHEVYRTTLTGLGERVHLAHPDIGLNTHIDDVVNLILFEQLDNIILVGHSYGGMVITGVMDRIPDRIAHVFFLDALVPDDGMSAFETSGISGFDPNKALPPGFRIVDGRIYLPWINPDTYVDMPYPKDVPQPLKTFTDPVSFKNEQAKKIPVTYIAFGTSERLADGSMINEANRQRARERGWKMETLISDHNAQRTHPEALVKLLEFNSPDE